MNEHSVTAQPVAPLPSDNLARNLKIARPDTDEGLPHIGLVGDTYTILLSGADTAAAIASSTCTSRLGAVRRRIGTTSRNPSPSWKEKSKQPSAAKSRPCTQVKP